jgi:hypothetical protein
VRRLRHSSRDHRLWIKSHTTICRCQEAYIGPQKAARGRSRLPVAAKKISSAASHLLILSVSLKASTRSVALAAVASSVISEQTSDRPLNTAGSGSETGVRQLLAYEPEHAGLLDDHPQCLLDGEMSVVHREILHEDGDWHHPSKVPLRLDKWIYKKVFATGIGGR